MAKDNIKGKDSTCDLGLLEDGTVIIQFGALVKHMTFTPQQAVQLGVGFIQMGTRGESVQRVSPPGKTSTGPRRVQ